MKQLCEKCCRVVGIEDSFCRSCGSKFEEFLLDSAVFSLGGVKFLITVYESFGVKLTGF